MNFAETLSIYYWSLRYLKPSMIFWRIHRTIKGWVVQFAEQTGAVRLVFPDEKNIPATRAFPVLSSRYHCEKIDLALRTFTFLGDSETLPEDRAQRIARVQSKPLLWQFHFGYHDYLLALYNQSPHASTLRGIFDFMTEWEKDFPIVAAKSRKSPWHPYVLSIRIEAWVRLFGIAEETRFPLTDEDKRLKAVVHQMADVLLHNLEKGTLANHLFRNIKALIFAGLFLDDGLGRKYYRRGMELLDRELGEQILKDGCHFERSPMYHASLTSDVLDILEALHTSGSDVSAALNEAAGIMTSFLRGTLHPDGEVPFFNDSTASHTLKTQKVLQHGLTLCEAHRISVPEWKSPEGKLRSVESYSGLFVHKTPKLFFIADGGMVGPDYQPGHAHCDTLSFELSLNGRRFITDTGVYHYKDSKERRYSRSTLAHNTVRIDGTEQSEVWKSFRVGRRAKIVRWLASDHEAYRVFQAAHDGYTRLQAGLIHTRTFVLYGEEWIAVIDHLASTGRHTTESRLHFAPNVALRATDASTFVSIQQPENPVPVACFGYDGIEIVETEYYPAFGAKEVRSSLHMVCEAEFPLMTAHVLAPGGKLPGLRMDAGARTCAFDPGQSVPLIVSC